MRLIDTAYRVEPRAFGAILPSGARHAGRRATILGEASALEIRWDADARKYTLLDGMSLPEPKVKHYRREIWRPKAEGLDVELVIERAGPRTVRARLVEHYEVGKPTPVAAFAIFVADARQSPLAEFKAGARELEDGADTQVEEEAGKEGTRSSGWELSIEDGAEIRAEMVVDEKPQLSPAYRP